MKINDYANKSTKELKKAVFTVKIITGFLATVLFYLLISSTYSSIKGSLSSLWVVPIALSPILLLNLYNIKQIKKEIRKRELATVKK